jgi:hypothetical protein
MVIFQSEGCDSTHLESVPVHEVFEGKTVWDGVVEVFDLLGHPKAKRAYGWSHPEGPDDKGERFVIVLELPPVDSPKTAVQVAAANDIKKRYDHRKPQ